MKRAIVMCFAAMMLFVGNCSFAQVSTGTPSFATLDSEGIDVINVGNLNAHLTIPVRHKAGRGTNFNYDLTYDTSVWYPALVSGNYVWHPVASTATTGWGGLSGAGQSYIGYSTYYSSGQCTPNGSTWYTYQIWGYGNFYYVDIFGTRHNFGELGGVTRRAPVIAARKPAIRQVPRPNRWSLRMAPGIRCTSLPSAAARAPRPTSPVRITLKSSLPSSSIHRRVHRRAQQTQTETSITVSNGTYTDTLGHTSLFVSGAAPSNTSLTYALTTGSPELFVVKYESLTVQTKFGCTVANGGAVVSDYGPLTQNLVSEIDLPDIATNPNSKYTFT